MVNKENALGRIEQIKNYLMNIKSSAYRCDTDALVNQFENLDDMIDQLESLINSESGNSLNRPYGGL